MIKFEERPVLVGAASFSHDSYVTTTPASIVEADDDDEYPSIVQ
jgi:hypothetical protein